MFATFLYCNFFLLVLKEILSLYRSQKKCF